MMELEKSIEYDVDNRMCSACVYFLTSGSDDPCSGCIDQEAFISRFKKEGDVIKLADSGNRREFEMSRSARSCMNCRSYTVHQEEEPCKDCFRTGDHPNFETEIANKSCETCQFVPGGTLNSPPSSGRYCGRTDVCTFESDWAYWVQKQLPRDDSFGHNDSPTINKAELQDSGNRREFESGAMRDMQEGKGRCDLLPARAILRLAKHYEAGARKYSERNWERGIPLSVMLDSGIRHLLKYLDGQCDEDHLAAAAWNILGAMWMEEKRPEMQDLECRKVTWTPEEIQEQFDKMDNVIQREVLNSDGAEENYSS